MPGLDATFESAEPQEVNIADDQQSFPIPDVKDLDFRSALAQHLEKNPESSRSLDSEEGDTETIAAATRPAQTKVAATEEQTDDADEKKIVKPWARARRLEVERDAKEAELSDLRNRLDVLTGVLQQQIEAKATVPQEEEIDPDLEPVKAILHKISKLEGKISKIETGGQEAMRSVTTSQVIGAVNEAMQTQLGEDPVFKEAILHVAGVMEKSAAKKYPNLNEQQRLSVVTDAINRTKLEWAQRGADPVQETYDMAMTLGFDPEATEAKLRTAGQGSEGQKAQKQQSSQKEDIASKRQKAQSVSSLGGIEGGSPKPYDASTLSKAKNAEEFGQALDNMYKAGVLRKNNGRPGGTPDFATLLALAGKGKR